MMDFINVKMTLEKEKSSGGAMGGFSDLDYEIMFVVYTKLMTLIDVESFTHHEKGSIFGLDIDKAAGQSPALCHADSMNILLLKYFLKLLEFVLLYIINRKSINTKIALNYRSI